MSVDVIWQRRFDNLQARIDVLSQRIAAVPAVDRQATLKVLVDGLNGFAAKMFNYFYRGFDPSQAPVLEISSEYPVDHVLTKVLEQISYDLEAIDWAFEQRLHADSNMRWALEVGDKLAWAALEPALDAFNLREKQTTVLVYFQKFPEVRVIPYASVALIGLPITCVPKKEDEPVARDFLAIPHEVAHYVYGHGEGAGVRPLYEAITAEIAPKMAWGREWLEELFADVYGALIAGPLIAQSFQDLQMRFSQDRFLTDDGEHPSPFIRPDIYSKVIRKKQQTTWAEALTTRWKAKRDSRVVDSSPKIRYGRTGELKKPTDFISVVDSFDDTRLSPDQNTPLDTAIKTLMAWMPSITSAPWQEPLGSVPQAGASLSENELYTRFENWLQQGIAIPAPNDAVAANNVDALFTKWEVAGQNRLADLRQALLDQVVRAGKNEADDTLDVEQRATDTITHPLVWLTVLHAGGWGTKGPETNPVGG